ncbi:hypothetical protein BESB_016950 [Besnoitia besnoiti]|uniref:Major facilitator superfamily (MFS) profile domain-containing protein n=1 Tax=Besnoitia besnoiti TaxID=94643 RepID=A0A2A9M9V0_BESBE|nr:hypothetical protein BESB_016950 [Besnoitia besnoiti]PFH32377.1 hypothetical protein BESB_016950 [Besnoitia besnoiti]
MFWGAETDPSSRTRHVALLLRASQSHEQRREVPAVSGCAARSRDALERGDDGDAQDAEPRGRSQRERNLPPPWQLRRLVDRQDRCGEPTDAAGAQPAQSRGAAPLRTRIYVAAEARPAPPRELSDQPDEVVTALTNASVPTVPSTRLRRLRCLCPWRRRDARGEAPLPGDARTGSCRCSNICLLLCFTALNTLFFATAQGPIFDAYLFVVGNSSNVWVGEAESVSGLTSLLVAVPVGMAVDRFDRSKVCKVAACMTFLASAATTVGCSADSIPLLLLSLFLWGVTWELSSSASFAIFTDSMAPADRPYWFIVKGKSRAEENGALLEGSDQRIWECRHARAWASAIGPLLMALYFRLEGDDWKLPILHRAVVAGTLLCGPSAGAVLSLVRRPEEDRPPSPSAASLPAFRVSSSAHAFHAPAAALAGGREAHHRGTPAACGCREGELCGDREHTDARARGARRDTRRCSRHTGGGAAYGAGDYTPERAPLGSTGEWCQLSECRESEARGTPKRQRAAESRGGENEPEDDVEVALLEKPSASSHSLRVSLSAVLARRGFSARDIGRLNTCKRPSAAPAVPLAHGASLVRRQRQGCGEAEGPSEDAETINTFHVGSGTVDALCHQVVAPTVRRASGALRSVENAPLDGRPPAATEAIRQPVAPSLASLVLISAPSLRWRSRESDEPAVESAVPADGAKSLRALRCATASAELPQNPSEPCGASHLDLQDPRGGGGRKKVHEVPFSVAETTDAYSSCPGASMDTSSRSSSCFSSPRASASPPTPACLACSARRGHAALEAAAPAGSPSSVSPFSPSASSPPRPLAAPPGGAPSQGSASSWETCLGCVEPSAFIAAVECGLPLTAESHAAGTENSYISRPLLDDEREPPRPAEAGTDQDEEWQAALSRTQRQAENETRGKRALASDADAFQQTLARGMIPFIVAVSDIVRAIGAGMTVQFFPLFFKEIYFFRPLDLCFLATAYAVGIGLFMLIGERLSKLVGRACAAMLFCLGGLVMLLSMCVVQRLSVMLVCYLLRGALQNAVGPLTRSIIMDFTRKANRGKWNAVESFSSTLWSGSALVGGFLANRDYRFAFFVTAVLYAISWMIFMPVVFLMPAAEKLLRSARPADPTAGSLVSSAAPLSASPPPSTTSPALEPSASPAELSAPTP